MVGHDSVKLDSDAQRKRLLESLSPAFNANTVDVQEILQFSSDPLVMALLLFKLAEERQKTNQLLSELKEKNSSQFDSIMLELKTSQSRNAVDWLSNSTVLNLNASDASKRVLLPEQDQKIMAYVQRSGSASAQEIQMALNYRGKNGACQRLNQLARSGLLKKMQSGKRVLFFPTGV